MRLRKKDTLWWRLSLFCDLSQIFYKHSGKLIGQDDVQTLLDNLSQSAPSLVVSGKIGSSSQSYRCFKGITVGKSANK